MRRSFFQTSYGLISSAFVVTCACVLLFYLSFAKTKKKNQPRAQAAYSELSIAEAQKMLRMDQRSELEAFVADKHPEWEVTGDKILFKAPEAGQKSAEIPSMRLIAECLSYATELERIV